MNSPKDKVLSQAHHYEYQASMARSELYRNAKYAMSMMKQIDPHGEVPPWIAGALTKSANYLDKIYHYLDYYQKFEPEQLPEDMDGDMELGETSGGVTRQNLMMIIEYSTKLFDMIKPGDKLEGWVAMKLTTASECISSCKHYLDYVQFENHGLDDHFDEARRAKKHMQESVLNEQEDLAKASTILAAKDMSSKIQSIAEDVAKMSVEDLMPLVDIMRGQFGPESASAFNDVVKAALEELLDQATKAKETMEEAIDTLNKGGIPSAKSDIESAGDELDTTAEPESEESTDDLEADLANIGGEEEPESATTEPLGRSKKEELAETKKVEEKAVSQAQQQAAAIALAVQKGQQPESSLQGPSKEMYKMPTAKLKKFAKTPRKGLPKKVMESSKCKECGSTFESSTGYSSCKEHKGQKVLKEGNYQSLRAHKFIKENLQKYIDQYGDEGEQRCYIRAWNHYMPKTNEYKKFRNFIAESKEKIADLTQKFADHKVEFAKQLKEGVTSDPLKTGYGLIGTGLLEKISTTKKEMRKAQKKLNRALEEGVIGLLHTIDALNTSEQLTKVKHTTPYGVLYTTIAGKKSKKLFETVAERNYWVDYNSDRIKNVKLIGPETFDLAIDRNLKG